MRDLLVVLRELWEFLILGDGADRADSTTEVVSHPGTTIDLDRPPVESVPFGTDWDGTTTVIRSSIVSDGSVGYCKVATAAYLQRPVLTFDGKLGSVPYGKAVAMGHSVGRFVEITTGGEVGWMQQQQLTTDRMEIFPECHPGCFYGVEHDVTVKIRTLLNDEYVAGALQLPLTTEEYVTYQLLAHNIHIPWPHTRPRCAGSWHAILRGVSGIHVGVIPRTGSLLEWSDPASREGKLAYIEVVTPDNSVRISGVGIKEIGVYDTFQVALALWHEWRPVCISIT